jgi:hypothetical protein
MNVTNRTIKGNRDFDTFGKLMSKLFTGGVENESESVLRHFDTSTSPIQKHVYVKVGS